MNAATLWAYVAALVMALALWGRGLIKADRGDLIAGCCVFAATCLLGIRMAGVPLLGIALIAFGVATLLAGAFAGTACPLERRSRCTLCTGLILLGLLFLLVV